MQYDTMIFDYAKKFYTTEEYPALAYQRQQWESVKPFASLKILDATPVFRNTVLKYEALTAAGASLTIGISDVMPHDNNIVNRLRESGIHVVHSTQDQPVCQDIILDCAGAFSHWQARFGVSELTRSGAHVYANAGKPVFLADEGKIKRIETCLGTGDGFFRAMEKLGYTDWKDKRILVFGSGKVGTGIIIKATRKGAVVDVVTEPSTITPSVSKLICSCVDCNDIDAVRTILKEAQVVVTATGFKGVVSKYGMVSELIEKGTLLANMGVEDEFGDTFPSSSVLYEKHPLNFMLEEPTQMKYIDATMALHNAGAQYLINHPNETRLIKPSDEMENNIIEITRQKGLISEELELI